MPHYFSNFPQIQYTLPSLNRVNTVTDVTRRFVIRDFYKKNLFSFFKYDIIEGQRPDSVAYDLYGDTTLDWLILLPNEILDPYFLLSSLISKLIISSVDSLINPGK